ncbi:MAG: DUF2812 domain-containing protein [Lachnospiraceae bacterium]|nr:DUF2812 domain-containing protein [Lachnospiraceae bacterium]MCM1238379.1 DUF2812 domain-containing protein [Lachnospiraceae bacterium]MCM1303545.1 DUF2812 domain-containing protein [Butyrivibrio sp.]MCM1343269.1 DUF2812 domain-containing protein [Muribaculaceae bacterium]MCM1409301.1 DUF2812 domain-containing protein [Lachnospiraceae bacterium]
MIKFRFYLDKDKETTWLNSMVREGWAASGFFAGFYRFDPCEKGAYQYQVDFTDRLFSVSNDYREFMQEMGVEIVANWGFWTFLRRPASEGAFELYTDVDSQIEHYTKIRRMFKVAAVLELLCFFMELLAAYNGFPLGYAFAFLVGALALALSNMCFRTSDIIEKLKERKTGIAPAKRHRYLSPLLAWGMLLNSCALLMDGSLPNFVKLAVQILAIFLMLAGLFITVQRRDQ